MDRPFTKSILSFFVRNDVCSAGGSWMANLGDGWLLFIDDRSVVEVDIRWEIIPALGWVLDRSEVNVGREGALWRCWRTLSRCMVMVLLSVDCLVATDLGRLGMLSTLWVETRRALNIPCTGGILRTFRRISSVSKASRNISWALKTVNQDFNVHNYSCIHIYSLQRLSFHLVHMQI